MDIEILGSSKDLQKGFIMLALNLSLVIVKMFLNGISGIQNLRSVSFIAKRNLHLDMEKFLVLNRKPGGCIVYSRSL